MATTFCTLNANNLYARYRFGKTFPGDRTQKSQAGEGWGFLPHEDSSMLELMAPEECKLVARVLSDDGKTYPDVVCLQEVESIHALRRFNEEFLGGAYPHAVLIDSRDFRQIDVGVLSRLDIRHVRSHVDTLDPEPPSPKRPWLFSRDCLEVSVALNRSGSKVLTLFVNHFKSKYAESAAERTRGDAQRIRQADGVARIIAERFSPAERRTALFAVVGDLNDEPTSPALSQLHATGLLEDALARIGKPEDRWTHWFASDNTVSQLDHVLLSPALSKIVRDVPRIERRGIGFAHLLADGKPGPRTTVFRAREADAEGVAVDFRFARFADVSVARAASDHCAVFFDVG